MLEFKRLIDRDKQFLKVKEEEAKEQWGKKDVLWAGPSLINESIHN